MRKLKNFMEVNEMMLSMIISPLAITLLILGYLVGFGKLLMWSVTTIIVLETIWWTLSVISLTMIFISYYYNRKIK